MRIHKIKSYRTIFLFETFILFILILNIFNSSILNTYKLPIFLLIIDFFFFLVLGFEKDNKRLKNIITFDIWQIISRKVFYMML